MPQALLSLAPGRMRFLTSPLSCACLAPHFVLWPTSPLRWLSFCHLLRLLAWPLRSEDERVNPQDLVPAVCTSVCYVRAPLPLRSDLCTATCCVLYSLQTVARSRPLEPCRYWATMDLGGAGDDSGDHDPPRKRVKTERERDYTREARRPDKRTRQRLKKGRCRGGL